MFVLKIIYARRDPPGRRACSLQSINEIARTGTGNASTATRSSEAYTLVGEASMPCPEPSTLVLLDTAKGNNDNQSIPTEPAVFDTHFVEKDYHRPLIMTETCTLPSEGQITTDLVGHGLFDFTPPTAGRFPFFEMRPALPLNALPLQRTCLSVPKPKSGMPVNYGAVGVCRDRVALPPVARVLRLSLRHSQAPLLLADKSRCLRNAAFASWKGGRDSVGQLSVLKIVPRAKGLGRTTSQGGLDMRDSLRSWPTANDSNLEATILKEAMMASDSSPPRGLFCRLRQPLLARLNMFQFSVRAANRTRLIQS